MRPERAAAGPCRPWCQQWLIAAGGGEDERAWSFLSCLEINFLPKTISSENNYSLSSGGGRDDRIIYFQPKQESLWMTGTQHLLSIRKREQVWWEVCCRSLKPSIASADKHTCLCGLGVDAFDCIYQGWKLVFLPFFYNEYSVRDLVSGKSSQSILLPMDILVEHISTLANEYFWF